MNRLKQLREERNWSKRDAAKFLNKKYTTYIKHENEERSLDSETLLEYAKAYNVSVDYLIGRTEEKTATLGDGIISNSSLDKLMKVLPGLTEQQADFLLPQVLGLISARKGQDSQK